MPFGRDLRYRTDQEADEQNKPSGLGTDGQKGGRGSGRSLVHIRCPHLEGHCGNLETQTHQNEQQSNEKQRGVGQFLLLGGQHGEIGGIGRAKNQRNTEHHEGRRNATQDQVLHTGLQRGQLGPLEAVEHEEGHGDQLQANKEQHQIIGRCGKEHPDQGKDGEGKELRKPGAKFGRVIHSHQHHG